MIGEIFANALVRKRADEAIRAALAENERLRERLEQENVYLREQITLKHHHGRIIGRSRGPQESAFRRRACGSHRCAGSVAR
jgi:formate hydrogenlyase transcriptional activator